MDLIYVPSWISQVEHYWDEPTGGRLFPTADLVLAPDPVRPARFRHVRPGVARADARGADGRCRRGDGGRRLGSSGRVRAAGGRRHGGAVRGHTSRADHGARPVRSPAADVVGSRLRLGHAARGARGIRQQRWPRVVGRRLADRGRVAELGRQRSPAGVVRQARAAIGQPGNGGEADDDERGGRRSGRAAEHHGADARPAPQRRQDDRHPPLALPGRAHPRRQARRVARR